MNIDSLTKEALEDAVADFADYRRGVYPLSTLLQDPSTFGMLPVEKTLYLEVYKAFRASLLTKAPPA